ncbi:MAG: pantoate--beta-alanine ligase [Flavipsychrobacter sp.]
MIIFKKVADIQPYLLKIKEKGQIISFVPTMGALHQGHISLVQNAQGEDTITVASIFVNPTQFNDKKDYEKYPISVEDDITMLIDAGCDILFLPSVEEMYPEGADKMPTYDFGYLDTILEGKERPGHFEGVGQVVARLLDIVQPHKLYMGQKDYQQCMVVKNLLRQLGLNTELIICATQREPDGLAMSSRNRRLTEFQRAKAMLLYQCLVSIKTKQTDSSFSTVQKECIDILKDKGFVPEYVSLADADDLTLLEEYDANRNMVALVVAWLGDVRLIDNMLL